MKKKKKPPKTFRITSLRRVKLAPGEFLIFQTPPGTPMDRLHRAVKLMDAFRKKHRIDMPLLVIPSDVLVRKVGGAQKPVIPPRPG